MAFFIWRHAIEHTEKRSLKEIIFGKPKQEPSQLKQFKMLNGFAPVFSSYTGNVTTSDVYQTAVQAHARHFSKMIPQAVVKGADGKIKAGDPILNRILGLRPNELMSTATFLEKCAYQYFNFNNVYIYIKRNERGNIDGLWALDASSIELLEDNKNQIYFRFRFQGDMVTIPYFDLIHIPRNVSISDFMGGTNDTIKQVISIIETNYEGIEKAIKLSAFIRFIVELNSPTSPKGKEDKAKEFSDLFLNRGTDNDPFGVVIAGSTEKITQVQSQIKFMDCETTKLLDNKVYDYLAINEKIISSNFSENEWQSYYDSAVEPFLIKLSQELTYKLFTTSQYAAGNYILINVDKLQNASFETRINILKQCQQTGDMTVNERRELLYLKAVEDGDVRLVSKNYGTAATVSSVDAEEVDKTIKPTLDEGETVSQVSLNGAQIASLLQIVIAVNNGDLEYESAITLIVSSFPFADDIARKILGKKPTKKEIDKEKLDTSTDKETGDTNDK